MDHASAGVGHEVHLACWLPSAAPSEAAKPPHPCSSCSLSSCASWEARLLSRQQLAQRLPPDWVPLRQHPLQVFALSESGTDTWDHRVKQKHAHELHK